MSKKLFLKLIFVVATIMVFVPSVLSAGEYGTVVKKDGTKYENINTIVDKNCTVISIRQGDKDYNISFSDFDIIYDNVENDITNPILKSTDEPKKETWSSVVELKSKGDNVMEGWVSFLGTFSQPLGDYYGGINGNIGFEGHIVLSIDRKMAFRAIIARPGMSDKGPFGFGAMKLVAGLQVNTYEAEMIPGDAIYYGVTGLGLIKYKASSDLLLHVGSGAIIIMSPNFGFDISASLGLAVGTISRSKGYGMGYIVDLRGGICVLF